MRKINNNGKGFCLVQKQKKIIGNITDGDIRRFLTKAGSLKSKVLSAANKNINFICSDNLNLPNIHKNIFNKSVKYMPVLNKQRELKKILFPIVKFSTSLVKPYIQGNEIKYLTECVKSNWISSQGKFIQKFEQKFKKVFKVKYNLSTSNGTNALHLILSALNIKKNDEVIVPNYTFVGSINPIIYNHAKPKLVDIDDHYGIDPKKIEKFITKKTKAIIAVHLFGVPAKIIELKKICKKYNLFLIEDCAEAIGTYINKTHVGSYGDASMFSFFGNKTITTGEGGMACFKNKRSYQKALILRDHGMSKIKKYWHNNIGYNYRMTNMQASVGLAQLENYKKIIRKKRRIANIYINSLKKNVNIKLLPIKNNIINSYWFFIVEIKNIKKYKTVKLINFLKNSGIEARRSFYPLNEMNIYKKYSTSKKMIFSQIKSKSCILLPCWPGMSDEEVRYISKKLNSFF